MSFTGFTKFSDMTSDGNGSGSALPSAEPLSAAVPEPASPILFALAMPASALAVRRRSESMNHPPHRLTNANNSKFRSSGQKLIAILDILAYRTRINSAVLPRGWLAPLARLRRSELFVGHRSYRRSVGRPNTKQPNTLGGSLKSKPTCRNASGRSCTSAFFVFSSARG
jgi:hypothetical protein